MRDRTRWRQRPVRQLRENWPGNASLTPGEMLDVELALYLTNTVAPGYTAADTWTLMGGYPYGDAFLPDLGEAQRLRIRRARYYLTGLRRPHEWDLVLTDYLRLPVELRGFALESPAEVPLRKEVSWAPDRFADFENALTTPPHFNRRTLPVADSGSYGFSVHGRSQAVTFEQALLDAVGADQEIPAHDLEALPPGAGAPVEVTREELRAAARRMDDLEARDPFGKPNRWLKRLERVELLLRDEEQGRFREQDVFSVRGLCHLVGMVGAGKSTLRDILTFWAVVERGLRITLVVPDVAETLHTVNRLVRLGLSAAPVLGATTRDKHLGRLHRRLANAGAGSLLDHDDPAFAHLSTACAVDALRGLDTVTPLESGQAPCQDLTPITKHADRGPADPLAADESTEDREDRPGKAHTCPLWRTCPRHHASRELVTASIWVTTPAGLVSSGAPLQVGAERLRYLELACRRSDLIVVDEADQVQLRLDNAFAPSETLIGSQAANSWLDEVTRHKVAELSGLEGRRRLTRRDVDDWTSASDTVTTATNRCYSLLVNNADLRTWITQDYFSAFTLHEWLISNWFPDVVGSGGTEGEQTEPPAPGRTAAMEHVSEILSRFRDDPLQESESRGEDDQATPWANRITRLTLELLHPNRSAATRPRLRALLIELLDMTDVDGYLVPFEFTLLLAALHHRLNIMTTLWPRVEAALNLHGTANVISRRPPRDYDPVIPESPMGNVLGFQFKQEERVHDGGGRSGALRFFRCGGVGRELLTALPHLPEVDDRPGPNVLLMSGTSWAGKSTRYHIHAPVDAILRPHRDEVTAIERTRFEKLLLTWPGTSAPLRLSGNTTQQSRDNTLEQMLHQLAVPDRSLPGASSILQDELDDLPEGRKRLLLLVGSYEQARKAWEYLNNVPEWRNRVIRLVSDDTDLDDTWTVLRRGDVSAFPDGDGQILVAPLLAVERGHNIVLPDGRAAIGTVYFLNRPHPRPDDISLAVQSIHDWAVRQIHGIDRAFLDEARKACSPDLAGRNFRAKARKEWTRLLTRRMSWSSLEADEKTAFTWDQLVVIWQVIGRLVRGGVPARAVFVDSAFFPEEARQGTDTPKTGLLVAMREALRPYIEGVDDTEPIDRSLVESLYGPLYQALDELDY